MLVNENAMNLLKRIGLNQYESRIYTSLLSSGTLTAGEISELANVPRSRVYDVLTSLEKKGFAVIQVGRPVRYLAVSPEDALHRVKANFEEEYNSRLTTLDKLKDDIREELETIYEQGKDIMEPGEVIGVLRGRVNLYNHLKQMIDSSDERIVKMTTDAGVIRLDKHCKSSLENAKKRGVDMRIIANVSDKTHKNLKSLGAHSEVRKTSKVNGRFLVKDGKEAVIITSPDDSQQITGLWIKNPYLAGWMEGLFDHAWEKGENISL